MDIASRAAELFKELSALDKPRLVEEINAIRESLHGYSPFKSEPVDFVRWIRSEKVTANDYNPNSVAPPEMKLLEISIQSDGYTQPIVAWGRPLRIDVHVQEGCRVSEDTGWLIEHPHDLRYGRESWYAGKDGFTIDSLQAVRFARQEDALREINRFPVSLGKDLVARQHAWIPARVCAHGQLQRKCEICDAKAEAVHWRAKAEDSFEPIRKIADALAQGGFHCHDKPGFVADHVPGLVIEAVNELKFKRMDVAQLRTELSNAQRLRAEDSANEKRLGAERDAAHIEAAELRATLNHLGDSWRLIGESLREFGHEPAGEDQWVARVHAALTELDQRRRQRTSDPNLLVEILALTDDTTEDSEWLILHARLEKFLYATGERGLKNLLGTVTMLRDRLLDIGDEVLSKQVHEPRDGGLSVVLPPSNHVDCR